MRTSHPGGQVATVVESLEISSDMCKFLHKCEHFRVSFNALTKISFSHSCLHLVSSPLGPLQVFSE